MVKKTNVKSKKFYIIIATLCILSLHILDWTQTFNPTIQTNIEYLIILVILIAVPINPFYCSITIFIACILIYVIDDSYWITCYPFLFSIAIIAIYQGSILSACLAIIGTQLITILDSMHIILLSGLSYIGQPISLAWCIGTLIKNTIIIEQQNTKEAERESYRVHQINMLHILHDTIANDLVYTIIELRRVNTEITLLPMKKQIHNIIDILENALSQLRGIVIPSLKGQVLTTTDIAVHSSINTTLQVLSRNLEKNGFIGHIYLHGNLNELQIRYRILLNYCIQELGGNIIKYGLPGIFTLSIKITNDSISIISSNIEHHRNKQSNKFSGTGLTLLQDEIEKHKGRVLFASEDNEWSIYINIPLAGE